MKNPKPVSKEQYFKTAALCLSVSNTNLLEKRKRIYISVFTTDNFPLANKVAVDLSENDDILAVCNKLAIDIAAEFGFKWNHVLYQYFEDYHYDAKPVFDLTMPNRPILNQKEQVEHYFKEFVKLANQFWNENDKPHYEYWKGQVMGMSKVVNIFELDIDTSYYLKQLP